MIGSNILVYIDHVVQFRQTVVLQDDQNLISNTSVDTLAQYYYHDVQGVSQVAMFFRIWKIAIFVALEKFYRIR